MSLGRKLFSLEDVQESRFFNWISLTGLVIVAGSILAFILLMIIDVVTPAPNAYLGILAYFIAPLFLFLGIAFIFAGWLIEKRKAKRLGSGARPVTIDLSRAKDRQLALYFVLGGSIFLVITTIGSYQTYQYTESNVFCSMVCHETMKPESVRFQHSPHANLKCVSCHVGEGAESFLKAKTSGLRKVFELARDGFPRPITMHHFNVSNSKETCMQCHSQELKGQKLRTYHHYLSDESNTPFSVSMLLNLSQSTESVPKGIHWHINPDVQLEYLLQTNEYDEILASWVRVSYPDGSTHEYRTSDYVGTPDPSEIHTMECVTCHNHPAHKFEPPNDSIELALFKRKIDASLPEIKTVAVEALTAEYESVVIALKGIETHLKDTYGEKPIEDTIAVSKNIYELNFFPEMKADWRSYLDHTGHKNALGCFRCHNDDLTNEETGRVVKREDCDLCHKIVSQGDPVSMLDFSWEGFEFDHPDGDYMDFTCADCHTGGIQAE